MAARSSLKPSRHQRLWLPLREGDIVDVIAPGYRSTNTELEDGVRFLKSWGLVPRLPPRLFSRDVLCSNSDDSRFEQLRVALFARDSKAIWCIRGGYGSIRLMSQVTRLRRPAAPPKLFIGLSDITTLHVFLNQAWGWPTVHGPLLDRLGRKAALPKYERELKRFVFGELEEISFSGLKALNAAARGRGVVRGAVSGGNLTVLQSSLGTAAEWETKGRILFFEDIGERGYRIDRILAQFEQAGMFNSAKAVIFGQFTGGREPDGSSLVPAVLRRFAETMRIPVFSGLASGHDLIQRPLPFETPSWLKLGARGELVCSAGAAR